MGRTVRWKGEPGRLDRARALAATDDEIARQIVQDPDLAPELTEAETGWHRVYRPPVPDVRAIRRRLRLSQAAFAERFGLSVRTVQEWEQGKAVPDRPARILLRVIAHEPEAVDRALVAG